MSAIALLASTALALWLLASLDRMMLGGRLNRLLAPLDRFRFFGSWAMFAAGEGRKGAYGLAYRDTTNPDDATPWITAAQGHHWSWHLFLIDPRRSIADAIHSTGRDLHRQLQHPTPVSDSEVGFAQTRLRAYLHHLAPPSAGTTREIRVIKQLGAGASPEYQVICQFSAATDAES